MKRLLTYVLRKFQRGTDENSTVRNKPVPASLQLQATLIDTLLLSLTPAHATYRQHLQARGCWNYENQQTDSFTRWERVEVFYRAANPNKERES